MTRAANIFFGVFTTGAVIAAAITQPNSADPREEAIKNYRQWPLITPEAVYMEPWVASLCMPVPRLQKSNPHVPTYFKVYVNGVGKAAMRSKDGQRFPVGSIIVKEKFEHVMTLQEQWASNKPNAGKPKSFGKPNLLTVMVKRSKGFDPQNGDWEYYTAAGNGKPNPSDLSMKHCQSCHRSEEAKDYTFRIYGPPRRTETLLLQHP
ncbi:MAG: cytochrome P460 family protein [Chlorobia bacterium]|nr:cytochrome P460 family protein [Fimbriimonadaceae bacterium]